MLGSYELYSGLFVRLQYISIMFNLELRGTFTGIDWIIFELIELK